jgi:hypothetical protein
VRRGIGANAKRKVEALYQVEVVAPKIVQAIRRTLEEQAGTKSERLLSDIEAWEIQSKP